MVQLTEPNGKANQIPGTLVSPASTTAAYKLTTTHQPQKTKGKLTAKMIPVLKPVKRYLIKAELMVGESLLIFDSSASPDVLDAHSCTGHLLPKR